MGTHKTCDICWGAVKEGPIVLSIKLPAKSKKVSDGYSDQYDELIRYAMTNMFQAKVEDEGRTELCEACGAKVIGLIDAAKRLGKKHLDQFKSLLEE